MLPNHLTRLLILLSAGVAFASPCQALTLEEALATRVTPIHTVTETNKVATSGSVAARSQNDWQDQRASPTELRLEIPRQPVRQFDAVSGRANRQSAERDRMGSRAPLPAWHYTLGPVEPLAAGAYPELGPVWIGIELTFTTGRQVLGIHQDPSAGLDANSGTLGCIGLIKRNELLELARQVNKARIRKLVVTN